MKIAWFTPYHSHSAIGHYSQQAVAELRKKDEVVVFAPAGAAGLAPRHDRGPLESVGNGPYNTLARRLESFDAAVYNMGNHFSNHKMVYEVSIRHPGIVILHDLVLRDFFHGYHHPSQRDPNGLARHVLYNKGPATGPLPRAARRGPIPVETTTLQFPMFKSALRRCLGVIVHSEYSRRRVAASSSAPVTMLDFPPFGPCVTHAHETSPRLPDPAGKIRLLTFGVLNNNKLIDKVIEQIGRSDFLRAHVTYTIVGEGQQSYVQRLQTLVKTHNLAKVVCLAGRLSDHELWQRLTRADLVVNLRNPHMGESSATLLNALFAGAAVVVWNHGCYAEFPDDVVCKVSSEEELTLGLERLCRDRALLADMGSNARAHALTRFDASVYCQRFREFADDVRSAQPVLGLTDMVSDRLLEFGDHPPSELVERLAGEVASLAGTIPAAPTSLAA